MRYFFLVSFLFVSVAFGVKEVDQPLEHVFIPQGFDNNDSIQIVVSGHFKNSCFQLGLYSSEVSSEDKEIRLKVTAYAYENRCLQVEVPFFQTIYLGRISQAGDYKIIDDTNGNVLGTLAVQVAPPEGTGTDDTPYASTLDAFIHQESGKNVLHLLGLYSNNCLSIPKIEVRYQEDVVIVLPYLSFEEKVSCKSGEIPFEVTKELNQVLPAKFLLHVRSMGGQAINKVIILGSK